MVTGIADHDCALAKSLLISVSWHDVSPFEYRPEQDHHWRIGWGGMLLWVVV